MSYDLACFSRQPIAAIASVMGSMSPNRVDAIEANHPIPVLEIHGTADNIVKYTGGAGSPPFTRESLDIDVLISFWVNFNNCDTAAVMTIIPDTNTDDNSTVEHYVYSGGENGATVEFYKVIGGGHQWPGATDPIQTEFGNRNMDMNSSEVIWEFLSKKSYLTNIANAKAENTNIKIKVYPNPTSGIITVNCDICAVENQIITVYNTYGTVVYTEVLTNNNSKINLSNLAKGLYFYKAANQLSGSIVIQ
jgi:polyhydroxybutyrate depolymerase